MDELSWKLQQSFELSGAVAVITKSQNHQHANSSTLLSTTLLSATLKVRVGGR